MFLDGISLAGYRSFGTENQRIGPLRKINLLAGSNNCGKSNVLRLLHSHLKHLTVGGNESKFDPELDAHKHGRTSHIQVGIAVRRESQAVQSICQVSPHSDVPKLLALGQFGNEPEISWLEKRFNLAGNKQGEALVKAKEIMNTPRIDWDSIFRELFPSISGGSHEGRKIQILQTIYDRVWHRHYAPVEMIPAIRAVDDHKAERTDFSGKGIVSSLVKLRDPQYGNAKDRERFATIVGFVREVTGIADAQLEFPWSQDDLYVRSMDIPMPLSSLGNGIHEVIVLACAATIIQNSIVCLEEPEIHLHPILQRKLIHYLSTKTNNQYIISTHSAHILDTPDAALFHLEMINGATVCTQAMDVGEKFRLAQALGIRASDLLQSNCVIWVEGPSDLYYLRHWIQHHDHSLVEGIHYSIMFYGGKLLSHLDVESDEADVNDFIALAEINRHPAIVLDRDKDDDKAKLNETKERVLSAFTDYGGHSWVTDGREIENYIPHALLVEAVEAAQPGHGRFVQDKPFANALPKKRDSTGKATQKYVDKMAVASFVVSRPADLTKLGLENRIRDLVNYIREANHMEALKAKGTAQ